jgi:hypothetical protein
VHGLQHACVTHDTSRLLGFSGTSQTTIVCHLFVCPQFAKNIPKPEPPKQPPAASAAAVAPAANGAGKRAPGAAGGKEGGAPAHPAAAAQTPSELELLEQQHAESQAKVEKIRAELARLL